MTSLPGRNTGQKTAITRKETITEELYTQTSKIERLMEIAHTPGISVAVMCEGELIFAKGYGLSNCTKNKKATASTVYPISSLSKGFAALACGLLVADGKLNWGETSYSYQLY